MNESVLNLLSSTIQSHDTSYPRHETTLQSVQNARLLLAVNDLAELFGNPYQQFLPHQKHDSSRPRRKPSVFDKCGIRGESRLSANLKGPQCGSAIVLHTSQHVLSRDNLIVTLRHNVRSQ